MLSISFFALAILLVFGAFAAKFINPAKELEVPVRELELVLVVGADFEMSSVFSLLSPFSDLSPFSTFKVVPPPVK